MPCPVLPAAAVAVPHLAPAAGAALSAARAGRVLEGGLTWPTTLPLPDLAAAPLWLALLTVGVNALAGALQGVADDTGTRWDVVGVAVFAVLMGLGGGFVRDVLLGDLPAQSLRSPWYLGVCLAAVPAALLVGAWAQHLRPVILVVDTVGLGLFAVSGASQALAHGLPGTSAVLIGSVTAVGGGVLVAVVRAEVPSILLASVPNALVAVLAAVVHVLLVPVHPAVASCVAVAAALVSRFAAERLDLRTRPSRPLWRGRPRQV